jgi:hypothetical protein
VKGGGEGYRLEDGGWWLMGKGGLVLKKNFLLQKVQDISSSSSPKFIPGDAGLGMGVVGNVSGWEGSSNLMFHCVG